MIQLEAKPLVEKIRKDHIQRVAKFQAKRGRAPHLAVLLIGEDPASLVYVRNKHLACERVGIASSEHLFPESVSEQVVLDRIAELNLDPAVDGILVQLPLPKHLDKNKILKNILPQKDPDCLTLSNLGRMFAGQAQVKPCTPSGIMRVLEHYQVSVKGMSAVVLGRSLIVGKPMAILLTDADATVTLCHSRTLDVRKHTREADLVIVAAGRPREFGRDDFRTGAVVVDVGIHRMVGSVGEKTLCGDVRHEEMSGHLRALTPVPGGVGPMTIAMLLENTLVLAESGKELN